MKQIILVNKTKNISFRSMFIPKQDVHPNNLSEFLMERQ